MRIEQGEPLLIETSGRAGDRYTISGQALNPVIERSGRNRERDINNLARPSAALWSVGPGEERYDGAGRSSFITIVKLIGAGVVKVDGLLDEALPQDTGIKIDILLGISHNGGEMVKTSKGIGIHAFLPGDRSPCKALFFHSA